MLKRKLIKKWQKRIKKLTNDKIETEITSYISYPPEKVDDLVILIDNYENVKENEWRNEFRNYLNETEGFRGLETIAHNSNINPYLIDRYEEFKEEYIDMVYENAKRLYWENILLNILEEILELQFLIMKRMII